MEKEKIKLNIQKFVLFHKDRVKLLEGFIKNNIHHKLAVQISFLGIESLAKLLYPKMKSGERFIEILSKYQSARSKLKLKTDILGKEIEKELRIMADLREKYSFNKFNEKLLNERRDLLVSFKEELIVSWQKTLKEVEY